MQLAKTILQCALLIAMFADSILIGWLYFHLFQSLHGLKEGCEFGAGLRHATTKVVSSPCDEWKTLAVNQASNSQP